MKKYLICLLIPLLFSDCSKVPVTGRRQVDFIPSSQMLGLSNDSYRQFLSENRVISGTSESEMVKRVGVRIQNAVETYLTQTNNTEAIKGFAWEFNLVQDSAVNAWCMPGGKVVVYTGILPVVKDETGLAVVMGHEIAHAIANHGGERMSQGLVQQLGGVALGVALNDKPAETQALFNGLYAVGSSVGLILPYSRLHESEADRMGLIFMSMAGYNPEAAVEFWQRMKNTGGSEPWEIVSTHPSNNRRISDLKANMPEAKKYYKPQ